MSATLPRSPAATTDSSPPLQWWFAVRETTKSQRLRDSFCHLSSTAAIGFALLLSFAALAADPDVRFPVTSFQYFESLASDGSTNADVVSPVASYQYYETLGVDGATNVDVISPIVSYQDYDWPGDEVDLQFESSPLVSYQYYGQPLEILVHPQNQSVRQGVDVTLSVSAVGDPPLLFSWRRDGNAIPSVTTPTLHLNNVTLADAGFYTARAHI